MNSSQPASTRVTKKQINNLLRRESPALETTGKDPEPLYSFEFRFQTLVLCSGLEKANHRQTSFHLLNKKSFLNFCSCLSDPCLVLWTNHKGWSNRSCASYWRVEVSLTIQSLWRVDVLSWWHVMAKMGVQTIYAYDPGMKARMVPNLSAKVCPIGQPPLLKTSKIRAKQACQHIRFMPLFCSGLTSLMPSTSSQQKLTCQTSGLFKKNILSFDDENLVQHDLA